MKKKPNILIFLTDDQRFDTIHALGNDEIKTPNLDEFSKDCVCFTHAHIMGGTCGAVCMPSRAMLQTGRNLFSLYGEGKKNGSVIPVDHVTMPEYLRTKGYFTEHIGKWHQDREAFWRSYDSAERIMGFHNPGKKSYLHMGGHYNPILLDFDPTGVYDNEKSYNLDENHNKIPAKFANGRIHSTDVFCDAGVDFVKNYNNDKPFYLYLATVAPHDPRNSPDQFQRMYSTENVSTPKNFLPFHPFDNGDLYIRDEVLEYFPRTETAVRKHIAEYYAMISHIDNRFGDVMKALKDKGIYDDTIIIFAGDNGLALGQHGLLGKQNLYENSIRVPLMIKPAANYPAKHTDAYAYLFDIFPTLCDMCDLPVPESVNGTSLLPVISGQKEKVRPDLFMAYRNTQRSYKDDRYKIIEYFVDGERHTQLFDLANDPDEITNLADEAKYADLLKKMREKLHEKQVQYKDPLVMCSNQKLAEEIW